MFSCQFYGLKMLQSVKAVVKDQLVILAPNLCPNLCLKDKITEIDQYFWKLEEWLGFFSFPKTGINHRLVFFLNYISYTRPWSDSRPKSDFEIYVSIDLHRSLETSCRRGIRGLNWQVMDWYGYTWMLKSSVYYQFLGFTAR